MRRSVRHDTGDADALRRVLLTGVIWWDGSKHHLAGMECNSQAPATCDLKGGLTDITITWDGKKFQIDEMETHNGRHTIWREYWTDITPDSFTQSGDVTQPDGTTTRFLTIHGKRVKQLQTIGTEQSSTCRCEAAGECNRIRPRMCPTTRWRYVTSPEAS